MPTRQEKKKKNKPTPEQIRTDKRRRKLRARDHLRNMIEGNADMTNDEIKETIQKAFNKWEIRACRSMRQDIDDNTMLIMLLNKYHEDDEAETELIHQEKRDKKEKEIYKKTRRKLRKALANNTQTPL